MVRRRAVDNEELELWSRIRVGCNRRFTTALLKPTSDALCGLVRRRLIAQSPGNTAR
jgi:hypothetical protein